MTTLLTKQEGLDDLDLDPAMACALRLEEISRLLGVSILRILKISGKDPTYQMELDCGKVEFPTIGKLTDQKTMRLIIAGAADRWTTKVNQKQWEQIIQAMLASLTIVDGGEETEFVGSARVHLRDYLKDTRVGTVYEPPNSKNPSLADGHIAICLGDFQQYLNKNGHPSSAKEVASMLTAIGAVSVRTKSGPFRDKSRWHLPIENFPPAEYADVAEVPLDA